MSIVDDAGNAVSLTTTVNWRFGSLQVVRGAGFFLNNEMDDFATVPGTANGFGLTQGEPNAVAPGKRMLSSMAPTVVLAQDGHVELVLGAAGGPFITTAVFQILSNVVDFGFDPTSATNAPRFHAQDRPDVVLMEPHGLPDDVQGELVRMGYDVELVKYDHLADAMVIGKDGARWIGAADPRRSTSFALGR
jgi:gamma-glutamyltranspeptidase/glutathione hydrolase